VFDPAAGSAKAQATGRLALTPSGRRLPLEDEGSQAQVLELTEQGFYEIRGQKANSDVTVIASNVDPAESDLTPLDPAEIVVARDRQHGSERPDDELRDSPDTASPGAVTAAVVVSALRRNRAVRGRHPVLELVVENINDRTGFGRILIVWVKSRRVPEDPPFVGRM
jgi:hypothetical protein